MRKRISDNTSKNAVYSYISPKIKKMYMSTLNQGYIRKPYNLVTDKCESVARLANTAMETQKLPPQIYGAIKKYE